MKRSLTVVLAIYLFAFQAVAQSDRKNYTEYLQNLPFPMPAIHPPVFPAKEFSVQSFGAVADGQTLNTEAFTKAIDACTNAGGGSVIVPPGSYLTGPFELKSNVNLVVQQGAVILFSKDRSLYPIVKMKGSSSFRVASPIFADNAANIAITGEGIIDGGGDAWRPMKKNKYTESEWKNALASGGVLNSKGDVWWPSKEAMEGEEVLKKLKDKSSATAEDYLAARDFLRPYMVLFNNCKNVLIEDVTLRNSPNFVFYPSKCNNLVIRYAKIMNDWNAQNGDGIDISACKNVLIYQTTVSVGDDGICMKSSGGKGDSSVFNLENVVISDCIVYRAHGGFVIGSNTDGGMRNIAVRNCNFITTDIGIRVKSNAGRGGLVKDIYIDNIFMSDIREEAILFDTYYEDKPAGASDKKSGAAPKDKIPEFTGFHFNNITCTGAKTAIYFNAFPDMYAHHIEFNNVTISAKEGVLANYTSDLTFNNVNIINKTGAVYVLTNSRNYTIRDVYPPADRLFVNAGANTDNIIVRGKNADKIKQ